MTDETPAGAPTDSPSADSDRPMRSRVDTSTSAEADQARANREQTLADADQWTADGEQTAADRDQAASDLDQAASDSDLHHGGDLTVHQMTRDLRAGAASERRRGSDRRVHDAAGRDAVAQARDLVADARDEEAAHEEAAAIREHRLAGTKSTDNEHSVAEQGDARRAIRVAAAEARGRAAGDHELAASERARAATDRGQADAARAALAQGIVARTAFERAQAAKIAEQAALLELAPEPILALDAHRKITFWNAAAEHAYGFSSHEAIGRDPRELLHSEYPSALGDIERALTHDGTWEGDLVHTTKDGRRVSSAGRWSVLYDEAGEITGFLEAHRDITARLLTQAARERGRANAERERMSTRLLRSQRLESLGHLAGGIAHDFNNLLAVIGTYSAVIALRLGEIRESVGEPSWGSLNDDLQAIDKATGQAAGLTQQLLSFAQEESVAPGVSDLNETITQMLDILTRTLGSQIQVAASLAPDLDRVRVNSGQLGQILMNLAINSRSAMPDGGRLDIETASAQFDHDERLSLGLPSPGSYVRFRVTDTGVGMSPEVIEHAFDPFFTTRPIGEGTGLGLATVYGIVSQAGGQIEIHSEPGSWTTVTVLLPATDETVPHLVTESGGQSPSATGAATILIVDDEPALLDVTGRIVESAGYRTILAQGSAEALALAGASKGTIDLLLADVVMPDLIGPQLAERMLADRPSMSVLFMSGFARPSLDSARSPIDSRDLLKKPFTAAELLSRIAQTLEAGRHAR